MSLWRGGECGGARNLLSQMQIWTIGHSAHPLAEFLALLARQRIAIVADVRSFPGSRKHPQFGSAALAEGLRAAGIRYQHLPELGGRRRARADSRNTAWRSASFRGYADYMETPEFAAGVARLIKLARAGRTAYMCAEALWWRCHRALLSDFLKSRGFKVLHILGTGALEEHPYTSAARLTDRGLSYADEAGALSRAAGHGKAQHSSPG